MTDEDYVCRITDVEAYFNRRAWRYGGRGDLYLPDAREAMLFVTYCVDADFCGEPRPQPHLTPHIARIALEALAEFDRRWTAEA